MPYARRTPRPSARARWQLIIAPLALAIAGCGGSGAPATGGGATVSPQVTDTAPTAGETTGETKPAPPAESTAASRTAAAVSLADPCELVTQADAETALGAPVGAGQSTGTATDQVRKCIFDATDPGTGFLPDSVQVSLESFWATAEEFTAGTQSVSEGAEPLSGFGEAAFQEVDEDGEARVYAFADGVSTYVTVQHSGTDPAQLLERAKALLQQVMGEL